MNQTDRLNCLGIGNCDYIDSYEFTITDKKKKINISDIAEVFIQPGSKWFEALFSVRNKIASLFGLKTPATITNEEGIEKWETATQAGIFKIFGKTESEIILGEDDKHLDVRISLLLKESKHNKDEKEVIVTTVVKLHNQLGKCYFFIIKPIHRLIVPFILKRKLKQLESKN